MAEASGHGHYHYHSHYHCCHYSRNCLHTLSIIFSHSLSLSSPIPTVSKYPAGIYDIMECVWPRLRASLLQTHAIGPFPVERQGRSTAVSLGRTFLCIYCKDGIDQKRRTEKAVTTVERPTTRPFASTNNKQRKRLQQRVPPPGSPCSLRSTCFRLRSRPDGMAHHYQTITVPPQAQIK